MLMFLVRLALGGIFAVSASAKLLAPRRTLGDVRNYRLLPAKAATLFGVMLGPAEAGIAASLVTGIGVRWGALAALLLLTCFLTAVGITMLQKRNLECSCFGLLYRERVGWSTEIRDGVLWLLSAVVVVGGPEPGPSILIKDPSGRHVAAFLLMALVVTGALVLGWVAARGWPRWVVRVTQSR